MIIRLPKEDVLKAARSTGSTSTLGEPHKVVTPREQRIEELQQQLFAACAIGKVKATPAGYDTFGMPIYRVGEGAITLSDGYGFIARCGEGIEITSWAASAVGFAR